MSLLTAAALSTSSLVGLPSMADAAAKNTPPPPTTDETVVVVVEETTTTKAPVIPKQVRALDLSKLALTDATERYATAKKQAKLLEQADKRTSKATLEAKSNLALAKRVLVSSNDRLANAKNDRNRPKSAIASLATKVSKSLHLSLYLSIYIYTLDLHCAR